MESLNEAFNEMVMKRIYELEAQKRDHPEWSAKESRYWLLHKNLHSILQQIDLGDEFQELIRLQMEQTYEMYSSIYSLAFVDSIKISQK